MASSVTPIFLIAKSKFKLPPTWDIRENYVRQGLHISGQGLEHVCEDHLDHCEAGLVRQLKLNQEGGQVAGGKVWRSRQVRCPR